MRKFLLPAVAAAALFAAGCGGSGESSEPVATTEVSMAKSYVFEPEVIEVEAGAGALVEVAGHEGAVDAGADRAGEDDDVGFELGERHFTITVPSMSCLWSVQT